MPIFESHAEFTAAIERGEFTPGIHVYRIQHAPSCVPARCSCKPQYIVQLASAELFASSAQGTVWRPLLSPAPPKKRHTLSLALTEVVDIVGSRTACGPVAVNKLHALTLRLLAATISGGPNGPVLDALQAAIELLEKEAG